MDFGIETKISNFVKNQFPKFYLEEGPNFVLFVRAYYEWLESEDNPIYESRKLLDYRDIDTTLEDFLEYFQKKYLYSIPFDIIISKRYLLKHILDVYRSKSSIQGYKLLFKLIYNEDIEIYLPGRDVLKSSHGTWKEPRYVEITNYDNIDDYIGKTIIGKISRTKAVVESFTKETFTSSSINTLYISNISPKNGDFIIGENLYILNEEDANSAPSVIGSLDNLEIINGGQDLQIGDIIKIAQFDLSNGEVISTGRDGLLRISSVSRGIGALNFSIVNPGFGYNSNTLTFVYKNGNNGVGASFSIGSLISSNSYTYNEDIICDYLTKTLDAAQYDFPLSATANLTSNIGTCLTYTSELFGSLGTLSSIRTGNSYTSIPYTFVRSVLVSNTLTGNITYMSTSNTITGDGTTFTSYFTSNSVIQLQSNSSNSSTKEYAVIKEVTNTTSMILYGPPTLNSTTSAVHRVCPVIFPSNYALYETPMYRVDGEINGINEIVRGYPSQGNNVANTVVSINSGKAYVEGEIVKAYLYGAISNNINIVNGGINYTNGDLLIISSTTGKAANGYIITNSNGVIVNTSLTSAGSGYTTIPTLTVRSNTGSNAVLTCTIQEFNDIIEIVGRVQKSGIGKVPGYWTTTRGFLNSNKYIHDSYYYQDYSYEIKTAQTLDKYRDILYKTFHTAGAELFGKFLLINKNSSNLTILEESNTANTDLSIYLFADSTYYSADSSLTVDTI